MKILFCVLLTFGVFTLKAEKINSVDDYYYFFYLKDKLFTPTSASNLLSARSVARRTRYTIALTEQDYPVTAQYLAEIRNLGAIVIYSSKWLNAVLIKATPAIYTQITQKPFFKSLEFSQPVNLLNARISEKLLKPASEYSFPNQRTAINYGSNALAINQLNLAPVHEKGFKGKDILIGVFDDGFSNVNTISYFNSLINENRVVQTYDFVRNQKNVYDIGDHGTPVLSCIAAFQEGNFVGTAPEASFALFVTEDNTKETKLEEVMYLLAAERSDSLGVDIITSSLGYYDFDISTQNYFIPQLTGDYALISKAAKIATQKGIFVLNSAGNEGINSWKYLVFPADVANVLAVGAVDGNKNRATFSSLGLQNVNPTFKPDVVALGYNLATVSVLGSLSNVSGTSFSTPLTAGMVACLLQSNKSIKPLELKSLILRSGSNASAPNYTIGYGIPNALGVYAAMFPLSNQKEESTEVYLTENKLVIHFSKPTDINEISVWDKSGREIGLSFQNLSNRQNVVLNWSYTIPTGLYLVRIITKESVRTEKILYWN